LSQTACNSAVRPLNRLLATLPDLEFERLRPQLTTVSIERRQVFHRQHEPIDRVYFLNGGVASVTVGGADGQLVEVATVGVEGVLGVGAMFGPQATPSETMLQVPDSTAESLSAVDFRAELLRRGALHESVNRYAQAFMGMIMQSTACISLHTVQERCCRWLLQVHDRVGRDHFELSHEFLAMMLGASRPTVSLVARSIQEAGLIRYSYGRITITNRADLEGASCDCYAVTRELFTALAL
jgi:CRP-like cAMP-binding protein